MVTREKHTTSDYGSKKDIVVKQEYPSEDAWFTVTVRERESGKIVAEDGFGKGFGTATDKRIYLGKYGGDYLIELSGNEVKVHVEMRAGGACSLGGGRSLNGFFPSNSGICSHCHAFSSPGEQSFLTWRT
ncbi:hypothetical protein [Methanoculleus chikugoensis]|uniref:hypothetical protein n=1 Tax=Methanoculleus chikugoensis TaxID=118126 RepID=UPI001FB2E44E|nr:hypothetical protein [Methanoculleus chikugoensis]